MGLDLAAPVPVVPTTEKKPCVWVEETGQQLQAAPSAMGKRQVSRTGACGSKCRSPEKQGNGGRDDTGV